MAAATTTQRKAFDIRGESASLATKMRAAQPGDEIIELNVADIEADPTQPRRHFDQAKMEELATSIRENGVIQAIGVRARKDGDKPYRLVWGERRWRGSKMAGRKTIKAVLRDLTDEQVADIRVQQLIENEQRADFTVAERVNGYLPVIDEFGLDKAVLKTSKKKSWLSKLSTIGRAGGVVDQVLAANMIGDLEYAYQFARLAKIDETAAERLYTAWLDPERRTNQRQQIADALARAEGRDEPGSAGSSSRAAPSRGLDRLLDTSKSSKSAGRSGGQNDDAPARTRGASSGESVPVLQVKTIERAGKLLVVHTQDGALTFDSSLVKAVGRLK